AVVDIEISVLSYRRKPANLYADHYRLKQGTRFIMRPITRTAAAVTLLLCLPLGAAQAATFKETIEVFRNSGDSAAFFANSYAYAVFPTVGSGALGVGGAY